jgi:hypothetical protein
MGAIERPDGDRARSVDRRQTGSTPGYFRSIAGGHAGQLAWKGPEIGQRSEKQLVPVQVASQPPPAASSSGVSTGLIASPRSRSYGKRPHLQVASGRVDLPLDQQAVAHGVKIRGIDLHAPARALL